MFPIENDRFSIQPQEVWEMFDLSSRKARREEFLRQVAQAGVRQVATPAWERTKRETRDHQLAVMAAEAEAVTELVERVTRVCKENDVEISSEYFLDVAEIGSNLSSVRRRLERKAL